jgi:hypothetical protein
VIAVAESGIATGADVRRLRAAVSTLSSSA